MLQSVASVRWREDEMDAYTCIRTKRDSRAYKDQAIPDASLERILQAGRMAGSSKNTQPWRNPSISVAPAGSTRSWASGFRFA